VTYFALSPVAPMSVMMTSSIVQALDVDRRAVSDPLAESSPDGADTQDLTREVLRFCVGYDNWLSGDRALQRIGFTQINADGRRCTTTRRQGDILDPVQPQAV
jgi:hypothetical protein